MPEKSYTLEVEFYGFPAYAIDELLNMGLHGLTKEGVVERIVSDWLERKVGDLEGLGITMEGAREKNYLPIPWWESEYADIINKK